MKKLLSFMLIFALALSFCACGTGVKEKYKNIGLFADDEYSLYEDMTFKSTNDMEGTYVVNTDGGIWFSRGVEQGFVFEKATKYYYKVGGPDSFTHDISEDAFEVTFDEKGHSNQSFYTSANGEYFTLDLKEDGTYKATYELYNEDDYSIIEAKEFEGKYNLKGEILWLKHKGNKYPMIYTGDSLFYHVIKRVK